MYRAKGAQINADTKDGQRPLDYAEGNGGETFGSGGGSPEAAAALRQMGATATGKVVPPKMPVL